MRQKLKRINTHIGELQFQKLSQLSEQTGISFSELLRRAIDEYLERKQQYVSIYSDKSTHP